ncbi:glycogen debranching protein GlgX [Calidifontibacter sp. DB0510]|uniref:Glycogen debranching protein GlgX n=1 Tax=Metallococcus carri TaxID=1656884 RepID=A0A967EGY7_9MICO|nr:glycogen debranching protein GlgX [Metallococcus carri]NHN55698.1 glycogen debranching protein GlgX [Metallococcus carri]NOP38613.1 glycogen debranching protein GlgX [Calidifontibacter sp. DB2511S]
MPTPSVATVLRSLDAPPPLGATACPTGTEFGVYAAHATAVWVCLFDEHGTEQRVPLAQHAGGVWGGHVEGVGPGERYAFRADGPWAPREGHRYNPAKLLLDPYGRAIESEVQWSPEVFGHQVDDSFAGDDTIIDQRDSAAKMPRNVVIDPGFDWGADARPHVGWDRTVLYETHVRGLTMTNPDVPQHLRGTYAGVAHPATIAHLHRLGVTSVELLPVHASTDEPRLAQSGRTNYWGYNTLGFFAPQARYAAASDPQGVIDEFKGMVKLLHAAGIEVILDVVYNHTAEQSAPAGATLSWRGLDAAEYYRLDERGADIDVTGCGNSVDTAQHPTLQLVLDSLRYWVTEMHVDGFRFDLAVTLGRGADDFFTPDHPFFAALRTDPTFSGVKLIAEPWDLGPHGWRTGQFPSPWADWNDRFRDCARTFWVADLGAVTSGQSGHGVAELATRIAGSPDVFASRSPLASVNFVTAHDGFPLADLTAYDSKHNEANGEDNRDGSNDNRSWNFGVEGHDGASKDVQTMRRRAGRNLLATLLLSSGVPMLLGGDELRRTQGGNNNAYCQDNETSWYDWQLDDQDQALIDTTAFLIELRAAHPVLRQRSFFPGDPIEGDELAALHWHNIGGELMSTLEWQNPATRTVQAVFDGTDIGDTQLLLVLHGDVTEAQITLPAAQNVTAWKLLWDSACERPQDVPSTQLPVGGSYPMRAASFAVFAAG